MIPEIFEDFVEEEFDALLLLDVKIDNLHSFAECTESTELIPVNS